MVIISIPQHSVRATIQFFCDDDEDEHRTIAEQMWTTSSIVKWIDCSRYFTALLSSSGPGSVGWYSRPNHTQAYLSLSVACPGGWRWIVGRCWRMTLRINANIMRFRQIWKTIHFYSLNRIAHSPRPPPHFDLWSSSILFRSILICPVLSCPPCTFACWSSSPIWVEYSSCNVYLDSRFDSKEG